MFTTKTKEIVRLLVLSKDFCNTLYYNLPQRNWGFIGDAYDVYIQHTHAINKMNELKHQCSVFSWLLIIILLILQSEKSEWI